MLDTNTATVMPLDAKISRLSVLNACIKYRSLFGLGTVKIDTSSECSIMSTPPSTPTYSSMKKIQTFLGRKRKKRKNTKKNFFFKTFSASLTVLAGVSGHGRHSEVACLTASRIHKLPTSARTTTQPSTNVTLLACSPPLGLTLVKRIRSKQGQNNAKMRK